MKKEAKKIVIHQEEKNMLNSSNDEKEITYFGLMANKGVKNRDTSNNDNDDDACTSDDEEEEGETENDIPNEVFRYMIFLVITLNAS